MSTIKDPVSGRLLIPPTSPGGQFTLPTTGEPVLLSKAHYAQLVALIASNEAAAKKAIILPSKPRAGNGLTGAVSLPSAGKAMARQQSALAERLAKLEKTMRSSRTVATPASKNAQRAARLLACPDELRTTPDARLPTVPSPSSALRYSHKATGVGALTLDNFNMIVQAPGQTLWCLRTSTTGTLIQAGDLVALNMGRADFTWTVAEAGLSSLPSTGTGTVRLVPGYHVGYQASATTACPLVPTPVQYSANVSTSRGQIWFPLKDTSGNYQMLPFVGPQSFCVTVIGECTTVAAPGASSTTYPITAFSSGGVTTVFTALIPTTGQPVRDMLMLTGAPNQSPGDTTYYPSVTAASNIRIQSMASALSNKFAVVSYALGPGREGVFNVNTVMGYAATTNSLAVPVASLASRARQHSMGVLDPENAKWYAVNLATRLTSIADVEAPVMTDFSYIAMGADVPETLTASTFTPAQATQPGNQLCNLQGAGWGGAQTASIHFITNGASSTSVGIPVEYEMTLWLEAYLPPDTGLHTSQAMYHADFINWLQAIGTYPVLACADSFKDYLSTVWSSIKEGARSIGRHAFAVGKQVLRDAIVEAIIKGAGALV